MPIVTPPPNTQTPLVNKDITNNYPWVNWFSHLFTVLKSSTPNITTGTTAPTSTPLKVGNMFVDTSANKVYVSTGTSSSSDWIILN